MPNNKRYLRTPRLGRAEASFAVVAQNRKLETYKLVFEALKHITTLSSGSVLLLITLVEKVFKNPPPKLVLQWAFGSFLFAIGLCVIAMILLAFNASDGELKGRELTAFAVATSFGGVLFLIGIGYTVAAAVPNLV
jgi:hypothetical protein